MTELQDYIETKLREELSTWKEQDIYAISFFVYANEACEYNGYSNVTEFAISYNTEKDCGGAGAMDEERWNYAFWRQDEKPILVADGKNRGMDLLFSWYKENGIENIGYEDPSACYNEKMQYVGKSPEGYYQLLALITQIAQKLQESGFIREQFGKELPIVIHDLEYSWYTIEATRKANPAGQAAVFLAAMKQLGLVD